MIADLGFGTEIELPLSNTVCGHDPASTHDHSHASSMQSEIYKAFVISASPHPQLSVYYIFSLLVWIM